MTHKGVEGALCAPTAEHFPKRTMFLKQPKRVELHTVSLQEPPPSPANQYYHPKPPKGGNTMLFRVPSKLERQDRSVGLCLDFMGPYI